MTRITHFPDVLVPRDVNWFLEPRTKTGGPALNGFQQVVGPPNDIWRAELTFPPSLEAGIRIFRALQADMTGRLTLAWIKVWDRYQWTQLDAWGVAFSAQVAYSDGALFSDGLGFAPANLLVPIAVSGSERDVEVTLDATELVGQLPPGVFCSIDGWLHQIVAVGPVLSNQVAIRIRPGLRAPVAVGVEVNFEPRALVRFSADDTGRLPLSFGRFSEPTILVEEVMNRDGLFV